MAIFTPIYMQLDLKGDRYKTAVKKMQKLPDQKLLEIAHKAPAWTIRREAMKMISDQDILKDVALHGSVRDLKYIAIDKIKDPDVLAEIAGNDDNLKVRYSAARRLPDKSVAEKILTQMVKEDKCQGYLEDVRQLTDQSALADIALHGFWDEIRKAALFQIRDESLLPGVLSAFKDHLSREEVHCLLGNITDEDTFRKIAISARDPFICSVAFDHVTSGFEEIALNSKSSDVRRNAVLKITDQKILASIARNDPEARWEAVDMLTDQDTLAWIALQDDSQSVRIHAIEKLNDQSKLEQIASTGSDWHVRCAAAEKLEDKTLFEKIKRILELDEKKEKKEKKGHTHTWVEIPGSRIYTTDGNEFSCGKYTARCSQCGAVETKEFYHYWDA